MIGFILGISPALAALNICTDGAPAPTTLDDVRIGLHDLSGALDSHSEQAVRDAIGEVQRRLACLGERLPAELPLLPDLYLAEAYDALMRRDAIGPSAPEVMEGLLGAALMLDPSVQVHEMFGLAHPLRQRLEGARVRFASDLATGPREALTARLPRGEALLVNGREPAARVAGQPVIAQVVRRTQKEELVVWTGVIPPSLDAATWCQAWPEERPLCPTQAP